MRLANRTTYDTRVLRRIVCAVHRQLAKREGHALQQWPRLLVHIRYSRKGGHSGCAYVGGRTMWLRLPRDGAQALATVQLTAHELLHVYGFHHNQFTCPFKLPDEWAPLVAALHLAPVVPRRVVAPPKPKPDAQAVRFARVLAKEAAWLTRRKRADTALRKLRRQRRYYEKRLNGANNAGVAS